MIYIPAGSFDMGTPDGYTASNGDDEHPQHSVTLSGYYIGKYEVTRGEYRAFMNAGGYTTESYWSTDGWSWKVSHSRTEPYYWAESQNWGSPPGAFTQTDKHPVVGVSYYEAEAYCNWAGGHLPTEAQWERAARWTGTHANVYPWGDTWDAEKCNNWDDSLYPGWQTTPVGSYSSYGSPSGCQDMAGNVWEWCKDWYLSNYYSTSPGSDPPGPTSGSYRVLRGGGWLDFEINTRCAYRDLDNPFNYWDNYGFRIAR
jgi:formylglycine-generating enzyme required for sulfatase activity